MVNLNGWRRSVVERLEELGLQSRPALPDDDADLWVQVDDQPHPMGVVFMETQARLPVWPPTHDSVTMIAQPFISPVQGKRYRAMGQPFVDSAGNAWLHTPGLRIWVEGRRLPESHREEVRASTARRDDALTAAGLQVAFVLLTTPALVSAPVRTIAKAARTSVGSTQSAIRALDARGHLVGGAKNRRVLRRTDELTRHWLSGFQNQLLPKLQEEAFEGPDPEWWAGQARDNSFPGALSGEQAVRKWLKPTSTLVYGVPPWKDFRVAARLGRGPHPNVFLRRLFWDPHLVGTGSWALDLLVYVDLLVSGDPRQLEAAQHLRKDSRDLRKLLD